MPTFNPLHKLEGAIVEYIAAHPGSSIKELHEKINQQGLEVSLNGLYKPVNRMLNAQMIAKTEGKFFINQVWLQHLLQFVSTAEKNQVSLSASDIAFPFQEGQRYEFTADCLRGLDSIWNHALTKLSALIQDQQWYVYDSHPWYSLGMRDTERRLYEGIISQNKEICMLFGNTTFLDAYGAHLIEMQGYRVALTNDPPFLKEGHALWVGGHYIVECIFPEIISRNFSFFFESIQDISEFSPNLFSDVFKMKSTCKVTIRCDEQESERLKELFRPFFQA